VLVKGFELSTRFPFGFLRHRRRLTARDVDIVVYPKPEPITDELNLLPLQSGQTDLSAARRGTGSVDAERTIRCETICGISTGKQRPAARG
jgi:uncharacterized protein (DUF58 family)